MFARILVIVFALELALDFHLPDFMAGNRLHLRNLIDSFLLVIFCAPFLWLLVVRPLGQSVRAELRRVVQAGLLIRLLAIIFAAEMVIMFMFSSLKMRPWWVLFDGFVVTLVSAPFLWWTLFRSLPAASGGIGQEDELPPSLLLFYKLIGTIYVIELLSMTLVQFLLPESGPTANAWLDSTLLAMFCAPFLWWLVVLPLRQAALVEKARFESVSAQVVDAVITLDAGGLIESFNPAAARAFGYQADDVIGKPVQILLPPGDNGLDAMLAGAGDAASELCFREVSALRRDGTSLTMALSASRADLGDRRIFILILRDVTASRVADLEQKKTLSLLEATLESTADAIMAVDWERHILVCNKKFISMFDIPAQLIAERDNRKMIAYLKGLMADPQGYLARVEELYLNKEAVALDLLHLQDGRIFERYSQPQRIDGQSVGRVWGFRDITARTHAENRLKESEERFRQIFEQTEDAIVLMMPGTCTIIGVNPTAERLYGYSAQELVGHDLLVFKNDDDRLRFHKAVCNLGWDEVCRLDNLLNERKDGAEIIVSARAKVIKLRGQMVIYCTFRDITDRVRMEEEGRSIQAQLILTNKMTSLGLLVAGIAHEINNPNNYIMANAQLLSKVWEDSVPYLEERYQRFGDFTLAGLPVSELRTALPEMLEGIAEGSRRIRDTINNLKNYARQGRVAIDAPVDVNRVISLACSLLNHHVTRHTDNFRLELEDLLPEIRGSAQQLEQVIVNLVMNALQSLTSKRQGVLVATRHDRENNQVVIVVQDGGSGIPDDIRERIMEPFFTTKLDLGGTGLGLSICQTIIKAHRGKMEIASSPGQGTTFTISLPVLRGDDR
jgi:PAS domain S-box-containing protein